MKKFLVLLLVVTLAAFVFVGCDLIPSEGEGEGEGEGPIPAVAVQVAGQVAVGGKTYVKSGNHDITVTLSTPAKGYVTAYVTDCVGDYSKQYNNNYTVLFPNADNTVWSGSAFFGCCEGFEPGSDCQPGCTPCCASGIVVVIGECDTCEYFFPVIVDSEAPKVDLEVRFVQCTSCDPCDPQDGYKMEWRVPNTGDTCDPDFCCGDDCSGIKEWTMYIDKDPCGGPCETITGTGCPVEGVTSCSCLIAKEGETMEYTIEFEMEDHVGNKLEAEWVVEIDSYGDIYLNGDYVGDEWTQVLECVEVLP